MLIPSGDVDGFALPNAPGLRGVPLPPPPPDPLAPLVRPVAHALRQAGAAPGAVFWASVTLKAELVALGTWVRERLGDTTAAEAVLDEVVRGAQRWLSPGGLAGDVALVLGAGGGEAEAPAARRLARRLNWRPPTDTIAGAALDLALRARAAREGLPPEELVATALGEALARAAELGDSLSLPTPTPMPAPGWPAPLDVWRRLADAAVAAVADDLAREPTPPGWERLVTGLIVPGTGLSPGRGGRPAQLTPADKRRVLSVLVRRAVRDGTTPGALTLDLVAELLDAACARGGVTVAGKKIPLPPPLSDHALDVEDIRARRQRRLRQWLADIGLPRWADARTALLALAP